MEIINRGRMRKVSILSKGWNLNTRRGETLKPSSFTLVYFDVRSGSSAIVLWR